MRLIRWMNEYISMVAKHSTLDRKMLRALISLGQQKSMSFGLPCPSFPSWKKQGLDTIYFNACIYLCTFIHISSLISLANSSFNFCQRSFWHIQKAIASYTQDKELLDHSNDLMYVSSLTLVMYKNILSDPHILGFWRLNHSCLCQAFWQLPVCVYIVFASKGGCRAVWLHHSPQLQPLLLHPLNVPPVRHTAQASNMQTRNSIRSTKFKEISPLANVVFTTLSSRQGSSGKPISVKILSSSCSNELVQALEPGTL